MPAVDYIYVPRYGVEDYKSVAEGAVNLGGAKETNDNLLVTLWRGVSDAPLTLGDLIVPDYANDNETEDQRSAYEQAARSRYSSRFYMDNAGSSPKPVEIFAVLRPPAEYKQQLQGAVKRVGDVAGAFADLYDINNSLEICYTWYAKVINNPAGDGMNSFRTPSATGDMEGFYSEYLPLPRGVSSNTLPFLKTNGADGNTPQLFDMSTNNGIDELIAAVDAGVFWVGMYIFADFLTDGNPGEITIEFPHSTPRG